MATSGTTSTTVFRTQKVVDHAFRRCRLTPQQITAEHIQTAKDILYLQLSTLPSSVLSLWTIQSILLPMYTANPRVPCPIGVSNVLNVNIRTVQRVTGDDTASEGDADNAFDGDLETACTQTVANGYIQCEFSSATRIPIFGILPEVSGTWSYEMQGSNDGTTFTPFYVADEQAMVAGEWFWFDVDQMQEWSIIRLRATGGTILDVTELVLANTPNSIPLALINRDDYYNLPNKQFLGRPTEYWLDRQQDQQILTLWPNVQLQFTFAQLETQVQNFVQDVGTLRENLNIPQRWYDAIVWGLSKDLAIEIKEVGKDMIPITDARARESMALAVAGESDRAPSYLVPNIRPYTR